MRMAPIPSNFRPIVRLLTENLRKLVLILMVFRFDSLIFTQALNSPLSIESFSMKNMKNMKNIYRKINLHVLYALHGFMVSVRGLRGLRKNRHNAKSFPNLRTQAMICFLSCFKNFKGNIPKTKRYTGSWQWATMGI